MSNAAQPFRRLTQQEISALRWLAQHGASTRPVVLAAHLRAPIVSLWRLGLIEVWYRQSSSDDPHVASQFVTLSLAGWRRVQPFLSSRRGAAAPRIPSACNAFPQSPLNGATR